MIKHLVLAFSLATLVFMLVHHTLFIAFFIQTFSVNAVIAHNLGDPNADKFLQLFRFDLVCIHPLCIIQISSSHDHPISTFNFKPC